MSLIVPGIVSASRVVTPPIPPPAYNAPNGIHMGGDVFLVNDGGLVATDNDKFSMTGWFKLYSGSNLFAVNPLIMYTTSAYLESPPGTLHLTIWDPILSKNMAISAPSPSLGAWHSFIISFETNFAAGSKKAKIYIDDVDAGTILFDLYDAFSLAFNGLSLWFGSEGVPTGIVADFCDIRIMPGVSLLIDGDIPVETRRLFVDAYNRPIDPTIATDALGTPCVLFSGNRDTFPMNQGTGGPFTQQYYTGQLGSFYDADSSPSG